MAEANSRERNEPATPDFGLRKYRVRPGQKHFVSARGGPIKYIAGQTIRLTNQQYLRFKDKFEPLEQTGAELADEATQQKEDRTYEVVSAGNKKWNVVNNKTKKAMNEEPLTKTAANKLLQSLEKEEAKK